MPRIIIIIIIKGNARTLHLLFLKSMTFLTGEK